MEILTNKDAWALAYVAQFPNSPQLEMEEFFQSLSEKGRYLVKLMIKVRNDKNNCQSEVNQLDFKCVTGFLRWASSLGKFRKKYVCRARNKI